VAYEQGLLSQETFVHRLDQLFGERLIDPRQLIGDLSFRRAASWRSRIFAALRRSHSPRRGDELLLALEWAAATGELLVGRNHHCDVVLDDPTVSRQHARLVFRDGTWMVQDLASTNGTIVNGLPVGRCSLRPGDHVVLGEARLRID
jgi:hypothetical protein